MTLFLVLAVLLPWSIWRQMHEHELTTGGLFKLPLIFAAVGVVCTQFKAIPVDAAAIGFIAVSALLSISFGIWRGLRIDVWRAADGLRSKGNRTTLMLWVALLATKFALGALASITGWFPGDQVGEVFLFLAASFVAQNLVVATRAGLLGARRPAVTA